MITNQNTPDNVLVSSFMPYDSYGSYDKDRYTEIDPNHFHGLSESELLDFILNLSKLHQAIYVQDESDFDLYRIWIYYHPEDIDLVFSAKWIRFGSIPVNAVMRESGMWQIYYNGKSKIVHPEDITLI